MKRKVIAEGLRSMIKPATIRYPYVKVDVPEGFRGRAIFDPDKCIGCGACAESCPAGAIELNDVEGARIIEVWYGKCTFCARCEEVCPEGAIKLTRTFELASYSKDERARVEVGLAACIACGRKFAPTAQVERGLEKAAGLVEYGMEIEELRRLTFMCRECRTKIDNIKAARRMLIKLL